MKTATKNKFHAVKSCGFDSGAEREYGTLLELLKRAGEIKDYIHHPPAVKMFGRIEYHPDFLITENDGRQYYVETKGFETSSWRIKLNWLKDNSPLPLVVVKKISPTRFKVTERIKMGNMNPPVE